MSIGFSLQCLIRLPLTLKYTLPPSNSRSSALYISVLELYILYCCHVNTAILFILPVKNHSLIPGVLSTLSYCYRSICLRKLFCPVQIQQCHLSPRHSCHRSVMTNCTNLISEGSQQAGGMVNVEILFHSTKKSQHTLGTTSNSIQTQRISMYQPRRSWQHPSPKTSSPLLPSVSQRERFAQHNHFPLPKHHPATAP